MIIISGSKKYYNRIVPSGIWKYGSIGPEEDDVTKPVFTPFQKQQITKHHACAPGQLAWNIRI